MAERSRGGLGRGLAALIPTGPAGAVDLAPRPGSVDRPGPRSVALAEPAVALEPIPEGAAEYREVRVGAIKPNPKQPRTAFDEEALAELEHSIREFGLLQPIVVRESMPGSYKLVMGERRLRAAPRTTIGCSSPTSRMECSSSAPTSW